MRPLAAEAFGTFCLVFAGTGAVVVNDTHGGVVTHVGVNPRAVEFMREVGYDLTTHTSKPLAEFNGQEVEVAVTVGGGDECPLVNARRREEWQIADPKEMPPEQYREVRDLIERKVKEQGVRTMTP